MMQSLVDRAAGRVRFAVKMSELVTHRGVLTRPVVLSYVMGISPAIRDGSLAAVLMQFPQRFHCTKENREYLGRVMQAFEGLPLVLEIRHDSWRGEDAWQYIEDRGISLCLTDMPRLRGLPRESRRLCGRIGYLRFHGRNEYQWHRGEYPGARYDYYYAEQELVPWIETIEEMGRTGDTALAFFNNHVRAQAPRNAEMLMGMTGAAPKTAGYADLVSELV
jgi:uncharacterized protein YecE (DUF72 family)